MNTADLCSSRPQFQPTHLPRERRPLRSAPWGTWIIGWAATVWAHVGMAATHPDWDRSRVVGTPEPPAPYRVERAFPQLNFQGPVDFTLLPGEGRFLLLQQDGKILSFAADRGTAETNIVLDLRTFERPLDNALGFTLHPRFSENRYLFVNLNEPGGLTNGAQVRRFTLSSGSNPKATWNDSVPIIHWLSGGHNGCQLLFGPDGQLYISTGDAAAPDPPDGLRTGQGVQDLMSSILRIDVDHPSAGRAYSVPADNPFISLAGARPEVWAFGFRNPWRMTFAPDGTLWVGDVGWELWETLHRVTAGYNAGWSFVEGPNTSVRNDVTPGPTPVRRPLLALPHSEAASITGGRFYRGQKNPELRGAYVFGDWETGKFWSVRAEGDQVREFRELCDTTLRPIAFAEDAQHELLVLDHNGGIYELRPNDARHDPARFPRRLSETGLFTDTARQTPATGVEPYDIRVAMWADHATSQRWFGFPGNSPLVVTDRWNFPTNAVFAKTLSLALDAAKPDSAARIETQLLHFDGQTWRAYSYRWNQAQTDAELVPSEGTNVTLVVRDPAAPAGHREQVWRFHGRTECMRCHNPWGGNTLGFTLEQLDLPASAPNAPGQLARFEAAGYLRFDLRPTNVVRLPNLADVETSEPLRARAWLHVNCGHCHRFGAGGSVATFLNREVDDLGTRTVEQKPIRGGFGLESARVVAAGDPERSALFYRINTEGGGHMPHIGSRQADLQGIRLVSHWIRSLSALVATNDPEGAAARAGLKETRALAARVLEESASPGAGTVEKLVATTTGALALLDAAAQRAAGPQKMPNSVVNAAVQSPNPLVRDLFDRFLPAEQRRRVLGDTFVPAAVLGLRGDARRGRQLFHAEGGASCSRCHTCGGSGRAFGPDLTQIARKYTDPAALLEQIRYPSRVIAPEFVLHQVETRNGDGLSGFVVRRQPSGELVLRVESGQEVRVTSAELASDTASAQSAMPEGLLAVLTAQEAADLLAYLQNPTP